MFCSERGEDISHGRNESKHSCISDHIEENGRTSSYHRKKPSDHPRSKSLTRIIKRMTRPEFHWSTSACFSGEEWRTWFSHGILVD
jgi:hypothetical protein